MNFNEILKVGETLTKDYFVKPDDTAEYIGNKDVKMLSTPSMIKFMEITAACIVLDKLPRSCRVVGSKVNIKHINPTPIHSKVTVSAVLTSVEGNKLSYEVEAYNCKCKIGCGAYEQHIIHLEDFLNKEIK